ncbi:MAG: ABC transporter substrate-binding protein, partial [Candidatus Bathyarchaeia archaeon]
DGVGNLILSGKATPKGEGTFEITLTGEDTGKMRPGVYSLLLIVIGEEAALPSTALYTFMVTPEIAYFERLVRATEADLGNRISTLETDIGSLSESINKLSASLASIQNTVNIVLALSVVALIASIIAVVLSLRKK